MLPGTGPGGVRDVRGRLVEAVRAVVVRQAPGWTTSVSVGAASWQAEGPGSSPITGAELLARADDALDAAKPAGKNRAAVYGDEVAAGAEAAGG